MEYPIWAGILMVLLAYLVGSLSPSTVIARKFGVDLTKSGSGNPGATNVLRNLGWLPGVLTFVIDCIKGYLVPMLCVTFFDRNLAYFAAAAAILGHAFPLYLKGKGGKCVATGLGVCVALFPLGAAGLAAYMLSVAIVTRLISLASVTGFTLYALVLLIVPGLAPDAILPWFTLVLAAFIDWRHRENLVRLFTGKEKRLHVPRKGEKR